MSTGWYSRPPIEDMTQADWFNAKKHLNGNAYNTLKKTAKKAGAGEAKNPFSISFESSSQTSQHVRSLNAQSVEEFNKNIKGWADKVRAQTRSNIKSLIDKDVSLSKSIKVSFKFQNGEISAVGISFKREGAWLFHGAGKGYGGDTGKSQWYDKHGNRKKATPESLYKSGTGKRKAKDWITPVINSNIEELAYLIAQYDCSIVINTYDLLANDQAVSI